MKSRVVTFPGSLWGIRAAGRPDSNGDVRTDPSWRRWTTLTLETDPFFVFSARLECRRQRDGSLRILETRGQAHFPGGEPLRVVTRSIRDVVSGRLLEHLCAGRRRATRYRVRSSDIVVESLRAPSDGAAPVEAWVVAERRGIALPSLDARGAGPILTDPYSWLFDAAPTADAGAGAVVLTSSGARAARIAVDEAGGALRAFRDAATGRRRTLAVRERVVTFRIDAGPEAHEPFFGLDGPIEVRVEAATGTPIEIVAAVSGAPGRAELALASLA